ncbi:MAG: hypothetical protein CVU79_02990 [Elusimicrobia bacterium HGW-Elusimicrobia-3]|jgi:hypothetical protein|nr:MAG: hypothetical protein CVU79_02990 [Elusimicrobia bacterium HGW-Elusimicrobia-3]
MKRLILSALFFLCAAVSAPAYTDIGAKYTAGPDGYGGVSAFAEWGNDEYYLRPSLNTYASDLADRFSTYSFGAGLDRDRWSLGGEVSLTPETGGYQNQGLYADFTYNLLPAPDEAALFQDASLGAFAGLTMHEDLYAASTATVSVGRRGASVAALTDAFRLNQTDYGFTAGVKFFGVRASGRFTKTAYSEDITAENRELPLDIGGIGTSGFPDTAVSARLRVPGLPVVPEAGYSRTNYLLDQPSSESFAVGLSVKLSAAELSAGWENFNPGGGASRSDYLSLGLTLPF